MTPRKKPEVFIYALRCPDTNDVRYIGKAQDPKARLQGHMKDATRKNRPVCSWVKSLMVNGKSPVMTIEASCMGDWEIVEMAMIAQYRESGDLLNIADGGVAIPCTAAQRKESGDRLVSKMKDKNVMAVRHILCEAGRVAKSMSDVWPKERLDSFLGAISKIKVAAAKDAESVVRISLTKTVVSNIIRSKQCLA